MNNETTNTTSQVKGLVQAALFAALIILMAMVPFLGYIPLGFTRATIIHIPVILGALSAWPKERSFSRLDLWIDQSDQQYDESDSHIFCILTILFTGRNSGGICKHFNLFCAENSDRGCSLLCISWSQKGDDKMESIPKYSTFCGRDQRSAHKHIACYEYDLFLF